MKLARGDGDSARGASRRRGDDLGSKVGATVTITVDVARDRAGSVGGGLHEANLLIVFPQSPASSDSDERVSLLMKRLYAPVFSPSERRETPRSQFKIARSVGTARDRATGGALDPGEVLRAGELDRQRFAPRNPSSSFFLRAHQAPFRLASGPRRRRQHCQRIRLTTFRGASAVDPIEHSPGRPGVAAKI